MAMAGAMGGTNLIGSLMGNEATMDKNAMVYRQSDFAMNKSLQDYNIETLQAEMEYDEKSLEAKMARIQTSRDAAKTRAKLMAQMAESGVSGNSVMNLLGDVEMQEGITQGAIDSSMDSAKRNYFLKEQVAASKASSSITQTGFQRDLNVQDVSSPLSVVLGAANAGMQGYMLGSQMKGNTTTTQTAAEKKYVKTNFTDTGFSRGL